MGVQMTKLTFPIDTGDDTGEDAEGDDVEGPVTAGGTDVYNNEDDAGDGEGGVEVERKTAKSNKKKKRRMIESYFRKGVTSTSSTSCPTSPIPAEPSSCSSSCNMPCDDYITIDNVYNDPDDDTSETGILVGDNSVTGGKATSRSTKDASRSETIEQLPTDKIPNSTTASPVGHPTAPLYKVDLPIAQQPCPICATPFSGSPSAFNMHVNQCLESLSRPSDPHLSHYSTHTGNKSNSGGLKPNNKKRPSSSVAAFFAPSSKVEPHKQKGLHIVYNNSSTSSDVVASQNSRPSLDGRESRFVYTIDDDDD